MVIENDMAANSHLLNLAAFGGFGVMGGVTKFIVTVILGNNGDVPNLKRDISLNAFIALPVAVLAGMAAQDMFPGKTYIWFAAAYFCGNLAQNIALFIHKDGMKLIKQRVLGHE